MQQVLHILPGSFAAINLIKQYLWVSLLQLQKLAVLAALGLLHCAFLCLPQTAAVQHVLSTVVQALKENPDRKFSYAEMVSVDVQEAASTLSAFCFFYNSNGG